MWCDPQLPSLEGGGHGVDPEPRNSSQNDMFILGKGGKNGGIPGWDFEAPAEEWWNFLLVSSCPSVW